MAQDLKPSAEARPAPDPAPASRVDAARIDAVITAWLNGEIANSPIARDTGAWNHLVAKLGALKAALLKDI